MGQSPACREGPRGGRRQLVFCLTALHVCLSVSSVVPCVGYWRRSQPQLETEAEAKQLVGAAHPSQAVLYLKGLCTAGVTSG